MLVFVQILVDSCGHAMLCQFNDNINRCHDELQNCRKQISVNIAKHISAIFIMPLAQHLLRTELCMPKTL